MAVAWLRKQAGGTTARVAFVAGELAGVESREQRRARKDWPRAWRAAALTEVCGSGEDAGPGGRRRRASTWRGRGSLRPGASSALRRLDPAQGQGERRRVRTEHRAARGPRGDRDAVRPGAEVARSATTTTKAGRRSCAYWLMYPARWRVRAERRGRRDALDRRRPGALAAHLRPRSAILDAAVAFDGPLSLVRHAKAGDREAWTEDDRLRPLTKKGKAPGRGARGAPRSAQGRPGPVEPVGALRADRAAARARAARRRGGAGRTPRRRLSRSRLALLRSTGGSVVACSHGDVIPAVVSALAGRGVDCQRTRMEEGVDLAPGARRRALHRRSVPASTVGTGPLVAARYPAGRNPSPSYIATIPSASGSASRTRSSTPSSYAAAIR